jgi:N-acetylglucosaminyldiphosphoundecaprenol N-acetyl-beta-D-mannosaminyltransferase
MSPSPDIPAVEVLGVRVDVLTPLRLVSEVRDFVEEDRHTYVTFIGVHGVMECQRNEDLRNVFNSAGISAPDGMPMVWAAKHAGVPGGTRCYGPDCMLDICSLAADEGWPIFLYGGKEGVAEQLAERLTTRYPSLLIVGTMSPPFRPLTPNEVEQEISEINASGARLVFVGIGTPKQDRWMAARLQELNANVLLGVGAAFDFHTGLVRQAPRWMQRSGLEWLFRLTMEPLRLSGRYLRNNPAFLFQILRHPPQALVPLSGIALRGSADWDEH